MKPEYDVVVVGSGYGGSVAALRFADAGLDVCLLERGRELLPGDYPESLPAAARETQLHLPSTTLNPGGMFDYHLYGSLNLLLGCGLGGGSLINAGVCILPDQRVFEEEAWPLKLRNPAELKEYYNRALSVLRPERVPSEVGLLKKDVLFKTLKGAAGEDGGLAERAFACVHYGEVTDDPPGPVRLKGCEYCGNCVTGCNCGAKKSLLMNYLPLASESGAEIFTDVLVRRVARQKDGDKKWRVYFRHVGDGRGCFSDAPDSFVMAKRVVLSAGTLGTTEILLRSRQHGLDLSDQIGKKFSGNGDVFALAYNGTDPVNGVGWRESNALAEEVGPTIAGVVDLRRGKASLFDGNGHVELKKGVIVEDGAIPSALAGILPYALWAASWWGTQEAGSTWQRLLQTRRAAVSLLGLGKGAYMGADRNTLVYLVMAHDDLDPAKGLGRIEFQNDRAVVTWPRYAQEKIFKRVTEILEKATKEVAGVYVPDPLTSMTRSDLLSVHPLGGCPMADSVEGGVVDDCGRVHNPGGGPYEGLYVMDGSFIPCSLGANPLLTITALAERACGKIIKEVTGGTVAGPKDPRLKVADDPAQGWRLEETVGGKGAKP